MRRPLHRLAHAAVLAALFCFTLELACRIEDWVHYRTPLLSRFRSQADLLVRDPLGAHGRPNARYQKWVMNELGMRGPAADSAPPLGTLRIVTAGASETFGLYESDAHEFPRQLQDSLNLALAHRTCSSIRRAEVLNAALPGMSLPTVEQDVRLRLAQLHPDVVVYYPTPVQYLEEHTPTAATPTSTGSTELSASNALWPRSLDRIRNQLKLLLPARIQTALRERETRAARARQSTGWAYTTLPQPQLAAFEHDLRTLVGSIHRIGAQPVLATHANAFERGSPSDPTRLAAWEKFYPRATGPVLVAFDSAGNAAIRRVAADSSVALADVATALRGSPTTRFADFAHFTDSGAALAAASVSSTVTQITETPDCTVRKSD